MGVAAIEGGEFNFQGFRIKFGFAAKLQNDPTLLRASMAYGDPIRRSRSRDASRRHSGARRRESRSPVAPAPRRYYYGAPVDRRSTSRSPPRRSRRDDDTRSSRWERPRRRDRSDD